MPLGAAEKYGQSVHPSELPEVEAIVHSTFQKLNEYAYICKA